MARAGPRKTRAYSREFQLTAVRLSQQPGIQVQAVAAALDIHPFMLSKWRKAARDGVLRGRGRDLRVPRVSAVRRLQDLKRAHVLPQEEQTKTGAMGTSWGSPRAGPALRDPAWMVLATVRARDEVWRVTPELTSGLKDLRQIELSPPIVWPPNWC